MAAGTLTPHLRVLDALTPIGHTAFGPIFRVAGGRGGGKIDFIIDDSDEDDDPFEDQDDDDEDDDDEPEDRDEDDEPDARRRPQRIRRRDPDEQDEPDDEDWTPPTRAEWERLQEAMRRNNGQLMKQRLAGKMLKRLGVDSEEELTDRLLAWGIDPETGNRFHDQQDDEHDDQDDNQDDDGERDDRRRPTRTREQLIGEQRRAEQRGAARAEARYKPAVALFATSAALREAGWKGSNLALGLRMIDSDKIEIEFDDAGEPIVYGLDEQIDEIRSDFPDLFRATNGAGEEKPARRPRARPGGARSVDGGERPRPQPKPATWLQRADAQLTGRTLR